MVYYCQIVGRTHTHTFSDGMSAKVQWKRLELNFTGYYYEFEYNCCGNHGTHAHAQLNAMLKLWACVLSWSMGHAVPFTVATEICSRVKINCKFTCTMDDCVCVCVSILKMKRPCCSNAPKMCQDHSDRHSSLLRLRCSVYARVKRGWEGEREREREREGGGRKRKIKIEFKIVECEITATIACHYSPCAAACAYTCTRTLTYHPKHVWTVVIEEKNYANSLQ